MGYPVDREVAYLREPFGTIQGRSFPHSGDDWSRRDKTAADAPMPEIFAAYAGEVVACGYHAQAGYRTVIAYDELPIFGVYAHQSRLHTYKGALVDEGRFIGRMGETGLTSGVHLHYSEYVDLARALSGIVAYWQGRKGLTLAQWARESGLTRPNYDRTVKTAQQEDEMTPEQYQALMEALQRNQADIEWLKRSIGGSNEHTPAIRDDLEWLKRSIGGSNQTTDPVRTTLRGLD